MTTSLTRVPSRPGDFVSPSGITAADAARVVAAIAAERAPSTLVLYASAWRAFTRWCATRGVDAFPAEPATVCAYLAQRAEQGLSIGTINVACAAIGYEHQRSGLPDPTPTPWSGAYDADCGASSVSRHAGEPAR